MKRENKLHAEKYRDKIEIVEEVYQNSPFNHWRKNLNNKSYLLASIPMVRNLFEYSGSDDKAKKLTDFLHIKDNTEELKISDLKEIYQDILDESDTEKINGGDNFFESLIQECNNLQADGSIRLEKKIILSIAIRLLAEKFMISKIDDKFFVRGIEKNQTRQLFEKYSKSLTQLDQEDGVIKLLEKVNLMTPENIHLNSFMYEPILDMGGEELKGLYQRIRKL